MAVEDKLEAYKFENWMPSETQEMIRKFWNYHNGAVDWIKSPSEQGLSEFSHHGPNPNGFQMPPYGATCEFFIQDWELTKQTGKEIFCIVKGRYYHRWNNMGGLIDENGKDWTVSTCDRWVRCFATIEERNKVLEKQ